MSGAEIASQEGRKRKKKLYNDIKEQMEFYFSDSNLLRDKFLLNLLDQTDDGFVDLEVFTKFNKIRSLTANLNEIVKAVSSSEILQVNQEKTKIRRATPVNLPTNVDDSTVYVENFPLNSDHAWLKNVFSSFGEVTYISLPKFKTSGQNKGFAFVEFSNSDATQRACLHFGALSSSREKSSEQRVEPSFSKCDSVYLESNLNVTKDNESIKSNNPLQFEPIQEVPEEGYGITGAPGKQKRKRKRRKKAKESEVLDLYIVAKKEWKQLKAKYLALQKENMAQMKHSLGLQFKEEEPAITEAQKSISAADFVPGVIVKLSLISPLSNAKTFKDCIVEKISVAYVDTKTNVEKVYIRCFNAEDANFLVKFDRILEHGTCEILKDQEEEDYWKKLQEDRAEKQKTKTRPKRRGRDKIISRAETLVSGAKPKHIYFEDN